MRVRIDREDCTSCGVCWSVCPEVFEESPADSQSQIAGAFRVGGEPGLGEVGEELRSGVTEAAEGCPVSIIHVE